jgi:hypothetical protein
MTKFGLVATALAALACPVSAGAQTLLPSESEAIIRHSEEVARQARELTRTRTAQDAPLCRDMPRGFKGPCMVVCDNCNTPEAQEALRRAEEQYRSIREGAERR